MKAFMGRRGCVRPSSLRDACRRACPSCEGEGAGVGSGVNVAVVVGEGARARGGGAMASAAAVASRALLDGFASRDDRRIGDW